MAGVTGRIRWSVAVPRTVVAHRLNFGCVRFAGGIEMTRASLLYMACAFACGQSVQETVAQGEKIFNQTCAAGYCHGAKGIAGGAPRLAARGFDQAFINATAARGIPGTAMPAVGPSLSRPDRAPRGAD